MGGGGILVDFACVLLSTELLFWELVDSEGWSSGSLQRKGKSVEIATPLTKFKIP